jgi:hypothetical protein
MSDVAIRPAAPQEYRQVGKFTPTYLVSLEAGKKELSFIATKYDETNNCARVVGFYTEETEQDILSKYDEIVKNTEKTNFVEISFPWHRVLSVRSLLYKHK